MSFDEKIFPLTQFLINNGFSISDKSTYSISYSSRSAFIELFYDSQIMLFDTRIGRSKNSLIDLTPGLIEEVFNDTSFRLQSSFTITDLVKFLEGTGKSLLEGNRQKLRELKNVSKKRLAEYTLKLLHEENLAKLDKAWDREDFQAYLKAFKPGDQSLLPASYLKKYEIALKKINAGKKK